MTAPEPFSAATDCHPRPEYGGADGCPNIEPCKLRCHIRFLDAQRQPNDDLADEANAAAWQRYWAAHPDEAAASARACRVPGRITSDRDGGES